MHRSPLLYRHSGICHSPIGHLLAIAVPLLGICGWALPLAAQPYNPYADSQDLLPPVAADGTLRWGSFYKSAAIQKSYERLWTLGACRGTNKAITVPVERNKMIIDNLPEEAFEGRVRAAAGTLAGGLVAFSEGAKVDPAAAVLVAQLHPAGVTSLQVGGRTVAAALKPGTAIRLRATVDEKGRASEPVRSIDIVTPPTEFTPDAVRANTLDTIVGTVLRFQNKTLLVRVGAGSIRRLILPVADDVSVMIVDASQLDLIGPGDEIEITGRRWSGEGSMAAGTVFASRIIVHKRPVPDATTEPAALAAAAPASP